ncbi:hypothetical protein KPL35_05280 [Clostridium sp. CF011]|uniref:hypothetical protein n=1 Tax=Clostridium sp. CF011 TaxID=2843318 RepID=UPI001C0CFC75|nr:hypothetical protein [Clostridium sp. CF011]MBU3091481.1 hypothetical protein [Clostridium sp. CF011]WAG69289.1 hypothetical protein LL036_15000 [Clostridium sp. CF011]
MKEYNKKILDDTKKISNKTYQKAMDDAQKATHPSPKVLKKGAQMSSIVGLTLLTAGVAGLFSEKEKWALGSLISGIIVIATNFINTTITK